MKNKNQNLHVALMCLLAVITSGRLYAEITAQKNSSLFVYRYEANTDAPQIENADHWIVFGAEPGVNSVRDGIISCTLGKDQMWISTEAVDSDLDHSTGWTYEVRLKIVTQSGTRGAISLAVDDQEAPSGGLSGIQIHADKTQWAIDGTAPSAARNDDAFHVFRLAEDANSQQVNLWRDGQYLGSHTGGHDFSQDTLMKYVLCGSWSGQLAGTVDIDYIRFDPTGAYAPYSPIVIDPGNGVEVSENGPTTGSFTVALDAQPANDVAVTITCNDGQVVLGETREDSVELIFTNSDFSAKTVSVTAVDDKLPEGAHTAAIAIIASSEDANYNDLSSFFNVAVIDNDVALALVGADQLTVDEDGLTSDSYEIHCLQQPTSDVEITITDNSDKLNLGSGLNDLTVKFTNTNWQNPATVTVTAVNETGWNRLMNYSILHTVASADNSFNGYDLPDITVRVIDNDHVHAMPDGYTIPTVDMDQPHRQVIVDKEQGVYLAHPTTVLLEDGYTMFAIYPRGSHARGECVIKRSIDGGRTWSDRLGEPGRPDNWLSPGIQEVPTIHRVVDPQGKRRLIVFTGLYPCRMAVSEDDGNTWSDFKPVGDWGGIVTMGCMSRLKDGTYMAMFHDDGRFFAASGSRTSTFKLYKTLSDDGGLTWSYPEVVIECDWAAPCEPGIVRSPDGNQLAVLLRENARKYNSLLMLSNDEGKTWSDLIELPASLTGDRHTAQHTPDGRLFISFRDRTHESPTRGDWVGWVGTYDDIINLRQGQYRVRIKDNLVGADTAYPGVEILPSGEIVTTTYGHWENDVEPYIIASRFRLSEIDAENAIQNEGADVDYCGQQGTIYLAGDINHDCYVNLEDMIEVALAWLECTAPNNEQNCIVQW